MHVLELQTRLLMLKLDLSCTSIKAQLVRVQVVEATVRLPIVERRRLDSKRRVGCGVVE